METLLIGNLTLDHNKFPGGSYTGPGGAVYFCARLLANLGVAPTLVSSYGPEFPKKDLAGTGVFPPQPNSPYTLVFENLYGRRGSRRQTVKYADRVEKIKIKSLPESIFAGKEILIVAPVLDIFKTKDYLFLSQKFKGQLKILLPQGAYRSIKKSGTVKKKEWRKALEVVPFYDVVVVSEKDLPGLNKKAQIWSKTGTLVIVTKAQKGVSIYNKGIRTDMPAFKIGKIADTTGAGDIFAAAFAYSYYKKKDPLQAACFAQAAAGLSLRFLPNELEYKYPEIIKFALRQGRVIDL